MKSALPLLLSPLALLLLPSPALSFAGIVGSPRRARPPNDPTVRWRGRTQPPSSPSPPPGAVSALHAAKKEKKKRGVGGGGVGGSGEGFGKVASSSSSSSPPPPAAAVREESGLFSSSSSRPLRSVVDLPPSRSTSSSSSSSRPAAASSVNDDVDLEGLSPEEKSRAILRSRFGLKSYEEQQADLGDYRAIADAEKKKERRDKLRNVEALWPEDRDLLAVMPAPVVKGIDAFLKLGLGVCTVLFVIAGMFITIEAGSKALERPLPDGLEEWVVRVVEPNFTPGLGVLLAFSVSLGLFSVGLGGSASSTYREDR
jgi:hypothetical protein